MSELKPKKRKLLITGEKLKVVDSSVTTKQTPEIEKIPVKEELKGRRRSINETMQLVLIVAIMIIILTPMIVIIISLMTGFNDTVVTQAFALFSNLSAIVIGGFLGRLTGENNRNIRPEKE